MDYTYFDKYLEDNINLGECISNHKNKILVFKEKIGNDIFYIKKYIPYGKDRLRIAFRLLDDRAIHYEKIAKRLNEIGIPYVKLEYSKIKKKSFFNRISITVSKYEGETLETYLNDGSKNNEDFIKIYYDFFIKLIKNRIYPIDYNVGGMLINKEGEVKLVDFDDYRINTFLTKKLKKRLIKNLKRIYLEEKREERFERFLKEEINRVIKNLGWEII